MDKTIEQHESGCAKDRAKERHDFIDNRIQPQFITLHKRIDKVNDKLEPLKENNITHKENIKEMKDTSKRIEDKLDKFIKKIEDNFVTKTEHKQTTDKVDNINKIMFWILTIFGAGIIGAILKVILA